MKDAYRAAMGAALGGSSLGSLVLASSYLAHASTTTITRMVIGAEGVWFGTMGLALAIIIAFHD